VTLGLLPQPAVGGVALVLLALLRQVKFKDDLLATSLGRIDWLGKAIFGTAVTSILLTFSWAGAVNPWSYKIIVTLIIGSLGPPGFLFFEASSFAPEPTMPPHLLSSRTWATEFGLTFLHGDVAIWAVYFLPVYSHGVLASTPGCSGVQQPPPIRHRKRRLRGQDGSHRPAHLADFAPTGVGFGRFGLLDERFRMGRLVGIQMVESAGAGLAIPVRCRPCSHR
jgi:hypothetical protein